MKANLLELSKEELSKKILSGDLRISVHGFGYVGAAVSSAFIKKGCKIIAHDLRKEVVERFTLGTWELAGDKKVTESIRKGINEKKITATTSYEKAVTSSSIHIITVPVSIKRKTNKVKVDLSQMVDACRNIGRFLEKGETISIETTLPPGTTESILKRILEKESGLETGKEFALIYSPERIFIGRALEDIEVNYPRIISGYDQKSLEIAATLYSIIAQKGVIRLSTIKAAETEKVFEGIYRNVNIALANELADYCTSECLNYWEILNAANSQPYSHLHKPGVGVGGACIPVYPYFILIKSKQPLKLTLIARKINEQRPTQIAERALRNYASKYGPTKQVNVTILGLSFRGDIADNRLSPSIDIAKYMLKKGFSVKVHDPYTYSTTNLPTEVKFTNNLSEALEKANILIVATDHSQYKKLTYTQIREHSSEKLLIEDPKNVLG